MEVIVRITVIPSTSFSSWSLRQSLKGYAQLSLIIVLGTAVVSCESRDIGQLLYNTGKAYCDNRPENCGGRRDGPR